MPGPDYWSRNPCLPSILPSGLASLLPLCASSFSFSLLSLPPSLPYYPSPEWQRDNCSSNLSRFIFSPVKANGGQFVMSHRGGNDRSYFYRAGKGRKVYPWPQAPFSAWCILFYFIFVCPNFLFWKMSKATVVQWTPTFPLSLSPAGNIVPCLLQPLCVLFITCVWICFFLLSPKPFESLVQTAWYFMPKPLMCISFNKWSPTKCPIFTLRIFNVDAEI